jgi:hypothetical protein
MAPLATTGIGVMSTIAYKGTHLEKAFRHGVNNDAWCDATLPLDRIGNQHALLNEVASVLDANSNVGLIVTVGGVEAAYAAFVTVGKPFISIFGGATTNFPGAIGGTFYGGVNLQTFAGNAARVTYLTATFGLTAAQICLLANPSSSEVYAQETTTWTGGVIYQAANQVQIRSSLHTFATTATQLAIIISADPFYQDQKEFLIYHANKTKKRVCYPLEVYKNVGGTPPASDRHTRYGPKLTAAYQQLGQMANAVVSTGAGSLINVSPEPAIDE